MFDAITTTAARLCDATLCVVLRYVGDQLHLVAHSEMPAEGLTAFRNLYPAPLERLPHAAAALTQRRAVQYEDLETDAAASNTSRRLGRAAAYRSALMVPMLREGAAIGTIGVGRSDPHGDPRPFAAREVALLETFASQAVIAIENVRLFQELEVRNRELTEALERQTATGEVLGVIARTRDDVGPVFEMILDNAMRLAGSEFGGVFRLKNGLVHVAAMRNPSPGMAEAMARYYPRPLEAEGAVTHAIREREIVHVADTEEGSFGAAPRDLARVGRFRSQLTVPLLRDGVAFGAIAVGGPKRGGLSEAQVAMSARSPPRRSSPSRTSACSRNCKRRTGRSRKHTPR